MGVAQPGDEVPGVVQHLSICHDAEVELVAVAEQGDVQPTPSMIAETGNWASSRAPAR